MFLAEAPVAPLVPEAFLTAIGIGTLAFFIVMLGLKIGWHYSLGALLRKMADIFTVKVPFTGIGIPGASALGDAFRAADDYVEGKLASGLLASETVVGKWWYYQKELVYYTYDSLAWSWNQTVGAFDSLVHGTIPQAVTVVTRPIANDLGKLRKALAAEAASLETQIVARAHALEAELTHDFGIAKRGIDYVRGTAVPQVWHWIRGAEAEIEALKRWETKVGNRRLTRLERLLGVGVISGIAIAALTRVFPYWQCRNVRKLLRGVCRSPGGWLDLLFGLGVEAFVVADLCDFIRALSAATRAVEPALLEFVAVENVLVGCPNASFPEPMGLRAEALPGRTTFAELPAY